MKKDRRQEIHNRKFKKRECHKKEEEKYIDKTVVQKKGKEKTRERRENGGGDGMRQRMTEKTR